MNIQEAREHLLQAESVIVSGSLKGYFLSTSEYISLLSLLREGQDAEHG